MVKIIADSSCDLFSIEGMDFASVPMTIYSDEISYLDNKDMDIKDMLDKFSTYKGRTYTACPGCGDWIEEFEGYDEIYVVALTSGLSGAYNSAMAAKDMYMQDHPEVKIHVFDTLATGPKMRLFMEKIVALKGQGMTFEEVCDQMKEYQETSKFYFALQSLHSLAQNGRVSKVVAKAIGTFGISIVATTDEEGKIKAIGKARGDKRIIRALMKEIEGSGYQGGKVRIAHVENPELAHKLEAAILKKYEDADILVYPSGGLCSYYAERGGLLIANET